MKNWWLYVLNCIQDKYYVGITSKTPEIRFIEHKNGIRPAKWTLKYTPIGIIYKEDLGDCKRERAEKYESKVVREYLKKYGANSTRGGDLTDLENYFIKFGYIFYEEKLITSIVILFLSAMLLIVGILYQLK